MMRDHFTMVELEQEVRTKVLAEVRAKVQALWLTQIVPPSRDTYGAAIKDVLALIDEASG